jgi:hypothetical protein
LLPVVRSEEQSLVKRSNQTTSFACKIIVFSFSGRWFLVVLRFIERHS